MTERSEGREGMRKGTQHDRAQRGPRRHAKRGRSMTERTEGHEGMRKGMQ
jgi:hypothetical protein